MFCPDLPLIGCPRESHQVLEWIRQLYDVEDRSHMWSSETRRQLRVAESIPVLDKIEASLAELARIVLPKSGLAKAVTYARNQWESESGAQRASLTPV